MQLTEIDDDLADLRTALDPIAAKWDSFAIQLGLLYSQTEAIQREHHKPAECLNNVLSEWLKGNYNKARHGHQSWRKVCKATANTAGGNNMALAIKLAEEHPVQQHAAEEEQLGY